MRTNWWKIIAVGGAVVVVGTGVYTLRQKRATIDLEVANLKAKYEELRREEKMVQEKIEYYESPENRLKEAKSQFNYREPGEQLLILVPKQTPQASSSKEKGN